MQGVRSFLNRQIKGVTSHGLECNLFSTSHGNCRHIFPLLSSFNFRGRAFQFCRDFSSSTPKIHRNQRKRKSLTQQSKVVTTRDRLRLLMETNQFIPTNKFQDTGLSVAPAAELLDLAQSRFTWLRTKVFQQWNPDYTEDPKQSSDGQNRLGTRRQYKTGLVVMDTRWWVWNILFALLPAIFIAFYCEFRAKPLMHEFHRQQELAQLRLILGEDEYTEERGNAIIEARNKDSKQYEEYDIDEQLLNYVISVFTKIFYGLYSAIFRMVDEPFQEINQVEQKGSIIDARKNSTVGSEEAESAPHKMSESHRLEPQLPEASRQPVAEIPANERTSRKEGSMQPTKEDLMVRIQQLEERLSTQKTSDAKQTPTQNEEMDDTEAIRLIAQRMKRMDQSNIQNRFEMDYKEKWRKYLNAGVSSDEKSPVTNTPEVSASQSIVKPSSDDSKHSHSTEAVIPSSPQSDDIVPGYLTSMLRMVGWRLIEREKQTDSSILPPQNVNNDVIPTQTSRERNEEHQGGENDRHQRADVQNVPNNNPGPLRSSDSEEQVSDCRPRQPWWRFWN